MTALYQLTNSSQIILRSDGTAIPVAPGNRDYDTYLAWVAAGNTADPAPQPSAAQQAQTTFQQLLAGGLAITCTTTTSLSSTYGTQMQDQINLTGTQTAINAGVTFFGWWRDAAGKKITMTQAQFTAIATAILDFISSCDDALDTALTGGTPSWPSASTTLSI